MAYRFKAADRSVERAVRRIAREQVDGALAAIANKDADIATHEVRKACKKVRALARLVRPSFPAYAAQNARFRDIARLLSASRDAKVMLDTFDLLAPDAPGDRDQALLAGFRMSLAAAIVSPEAGTEGADRLEHARVSLTSARAEIADWTLTCDNWPVIDGGLAKTVRQARKAAKAVRRDPTADAYHELRKLLKTHWYHTRLLTPFWPTMMRARSSELARLADLLGLHHDVCVFQARIAADVGDGDETSAARMMHLLATTRRSAIENAIAPLTARLLAQSAVGVADHWQKLWNIWRAECAIELGNRGK